MVNNQLIKVSRIFIGALEVHVVAETSKNVGAVIDLALDVDLHTAIPLISSFAIVAIALVVTHTAVAGEGKVSDFLFEVSNANAQVCEFVSIFASEFVQGCSLFSVQLIFFSEHTSDDLSHFITGDVSFALECAIRIAFYDTLVGEVYDCLVSPVGRCYIRERVCSVCGYASCECCNSSDCKDLFHILRSLKEI